MALPSLLAALFSAALGVTGVLFLLNAQFARTPGSPDDRPGRIGESTPGRPSRLDLAMRARTRFVAVETAHKQFRHKELGHTAPTAASIPAKTVKQAKKSAPKERQPHQAAAAWPWNLFSD